MKNTYDDVINDIINTKNYRIVIPVRQKILTKTESRRLTINRDIMKNASDDVIDDVINT